MDLRSPESGDETTRLVRRALSGEGESLNALIRRFQPYLEVQARYRLGPLGLAAIEPEDLIAETWLVALDRLPEFDLRTERATARLLGFLAKTLRYCANNHLRRAIRRRTEDEPTLEATDPRSGPITRLVRAERGGRLREAFACLTEEQREVLVLRAIEGLENAEVARRLRLEPNATSHRFQRALARLREHLGAEWPAELAEG